MTFRATQIFCLLGLALSSCNASSDEVDGLSLRPAAGGAASSGAGLEAPPVGQETWQTQAYVLDSRVGAEPGNAFTVSAPAGTQQFRIHFEDIVLAAGQTLALYDAGGVMLTSFAGVDERIMSPVVTGSTARLVLSAGDEGFFRINALSFSIEACAEAMPAPAPVLRPARNCADLVEVLRGRATDYLHWAQAQDAASGNEAVARGFFAPNQSIHASMSDEAYPADYHREDEVVRRASEPKRLINAGDRLYVISGEQLAAYKTWPADESELLATIPIEGFGRELLREGTRLVVLSGVDTPGQRTSPERWGLSPAWWNASSFTKVTVIDTSDDTLTIDAEYLIAGQYRHVGLQDGALRMVMSRALRWPSVSPDMSWDDQRAAVEHHPINRWLPQSYRIIDGQRRYIPRSCRDYLIPEETSVHDLMSVVTLDITSADAPVSEHSVLASVDMVQETNGSLYVATEQNGCHDEPENAWVSVYRFDTSDDETLAYSAGITIPGFAAFGENALSVSGMGPGMENAWLVGTHSTWSGSDWDTQNVLRSLVFEDGGALEEWGQVSFGAGMHPVRTAAFDAGRVVVSAGSGALGGVFTFDLGSPEYVPLLGEVQADGIFDRLEWLDRHHVFLGGTVPDRGPNAPAGTSISILNVRDLQEPILGHEHVVPHAPNSQPEALAQQPLIVYHHEDQASTSGRYVAVPTSGWVETDDPEAFWQSYVAGYELFFMTPWVVNSYGRVDMVDAVRALHGEASVPVWDWRYRPIPTLTFTDADAISAWDGGITRVPLFGINQGAAPTHLFLPNACQAAP